MNANTQGVIAIELLAAADGLEFRRPLKSSKALETAHSLVRSRIPRRIADREFGSDIENARNLIRKGVFAQLVGGLLE
jgi:histidine ammonia-lyase